ncbi:MAG: hypothetical protein Q7V31_04095 [Parvibaculum sp.]|uniref:hypothetical protein n=1 Tax=Parvibaculum sp. TaxID=2024848 RepID=UPI0027207D2A|nr:hypothetical protein [Parvibaculum sp.]MDO8838085.1 hypothetical protein [Parvibaculum sp.]
MTIALRKMGRQAFFYVADDPKATPKVWSQNLKPADVIHRYVDSGIPVILGLGPNMGAIGHAVVATGIINVQRPQNYHLPIQPTRSVFVDSILINDDQGGANLKASIDKNSVYGEVGWSIEDRLQYLIIPLPDKVYMSAEQAELLARNSLDNYERHWTQLQNQPGLGTSIDAAARFIDSKNNSKLIARTYLTFGYRYKERIIRNSISSTFKNEVIQANLPRYVWVTEFGEFSSQNHLDKSQQRISAHVVIDATASVLWEAELAMHAPGFWLIRSHDEARPYSEYLLNWGLIADDTEYRPKVRGS